MAAINSTSSLINGTSHQNCVLTDSTATKTYKIMGLSIVLLTGLVGNVLIIIVVYKNKELRRSINYFIVNMAISDLMLPLALIPSWLAWIAVHSNYKRTLIGKTPGLVVCKCVSFLTNCSLVVSVQSLIWIAIDRFVAVVFPMKFHFISSKFCAKAIISTWIVAVAVVVPSVLPHTMVKYKPAAQCRNDFSFSAANEIAGITYDGACVSASLILSLFVTTILYSAIALTLNRKARRLVNSSANIHRQSERKRRAVKMSFCIVGALYTCYLPVLFSILLPMFGRKILLSCWYNEIFYFTVNTVFYVSCTVNPVICFTFVGSYRRGVKQVLSSFCTKSSNLKRKMMKPDQITLKHIKHTGET